MLESSRKKELQPGDNCGYSRKNGEIGNIERVYRAYIIGEHRRHKV